MVSGIFEDLIDVTDGVCGGRPVIRGTRIEPRHLAPYFTEGDVQTVLENFPGLTEMQVKAAFAYLKAKEPSDE